MQSEKWSEVTLSCPIRCYPMDCRLPCSSIHGIFQARVLEWIAISFSRGSSQPRDWTQVSRIVGRCFTIWTTKEIQCKDFKVYAEYIMINAGLDKAEAGIKIAGRNINNLRYADGTTVMAENKVCHCFHCFPIYLPWGDGTRCLIFIFWMLGFKPASSLSSFTLIKKLFSSLFSAKVVSSAFLKLLFLPAILIPVCDSTSPAFHMMYSA